MESLIYHLLYEFGGHYHRSKKILNETRGVVTGLRDVVDLLSKETNRQVRDAVRGRTEICQIYSGDIRSRGFVSFFGDYYLELTVSYEAEANDVDYSGGLLSKYSFEDTENGILCHPYIRLRISGDDQRKIAETISFCLGHELTHAYDMYRYAKDNGYGAKDILANISYDQRYSGFLSAAKSPVPMKNFIGGLLYSLNRMERNAYIAQLRQEIENLPIYDSASAIRAIKRSSSYERFLVIDRKVQALQDSRLSDDTKHEVILITNELTGKKFSNYAQVKKYYTGRWEKWKRKYLSTVAKIAHDAYLDFKDRHKDDETYLGEIGL